MQVTYDKGKGLVLGFRSDELHVIFGVLAYLVKNWVPSDASAFLAVYRQVEQDLKVKLLREEEAKRYHLCCKCFRMVDTQKDEYHHTQFESGYEVYSHKNCPPVNKGKGYEQ